MPLPDDDDRSARIDRIRGMIAAGTYETPHRLQVAVDRLADELLGRPSTTDTNGAAEKD